MRVSTIRPVSSSEYRMQKAVASARALRADVVAQIAEMDDAAELSCACGGCTEFEILSGRVCVPVAEAHWEALANDWDMTYFADHGEWYDPSYEKWLEREEELADEAQMRAEFAEMEFPYSYEIYGPDE